MTWTMTWIPALSHGKPSSHLDAFAHHGGRLYVRFRNGAVHSYAVPENFVSGLKAAPSAGTYFNNFIKRRPHQRHEDMEAKDDQA